MFYEANIRLNTRDIPIKRILKHIVVWSVITCVALALGERNHLLMHSIIELFGVLIALLIAVFAYNSYPAYSRNKFVLVGIGYGFVGILSFFHILAYKGMGVFSTDSYNLGTQFSLLSKYIEAMSIIAAYVLHYIYLEKVIKLSKVIIVYLIASSFFVFLIL